MINVPISYSKIKQFLDCPIKYAHSYIFRTKVDDPLSYPLVLGTLTHLFIELTKYHGYNIHTILALKEDLEKLTSFITLKFLSFDIFKKSFSNNEMDISEGRKKYIDFINENEVVFFHAIKLYKQYMLHFHTKIDDCENHIEFTFNNIIKINDDFTVGLYGSIDALFYKMVRDKYFLYIGDFKTGKSLYSYYIEQLYFYLYNLKIYKDCDVLKNEDNVEELYKVKEIVNDPKTVNNLILFNLRENEFENKTELEVKNDYEKFINNFMKILDDDIYQIHKNKDLLEVDDIIIKYNERYNFIDVEEISESEWDFSCKFCKFKNLCNKRMRTKK